MSWKFGMESTREYNKMLMKDQLKDSFKKIFTSDYQFVSNIAQRQSILYCGN